MLIRKTWCLPERLRPSFDDRGKPTMERIPNHPTRLARATDVNTWLESDGIPEMTAGPVTIQSEGGIVVATRTFTLKWDK